MKVLLFALLAAISYAQTGCGCVEKWEFKGQTYSGCDPAAPKDKQPWCYVAGGAGCPEAKESTVKSGSFWRYCQADASSGATATDSNTVTHMVVVTKAGPSSGVPAAGAASTSETQYSGSGNPNEPPAEANAPAEMNAPASSDAEMNAPASSDSSDDAAPAIPGAETVQSGRGADAEGDDGHGDFKPLHKTMSEGRLLRKLWAEMNQIEALIHAANVDLKKRLIKAFKVVRTRMVEWEKMKDDNSGKKTEGQRLRGMWAAMGAIEDEIHEINIAMKKRLQGLIKALRAKMGIFDAAAARIDRMRKAQGKAISPPSGSAAEEARGGMDTMGGLQSQSAGVTASGGAQINTAGLTESGGLQSASAGVTPPGPCPPGEVAIAGAEGSVSCSPAGENSVAVPSWRRHLAEVDSMAPLVRTVSEGAKLRALWAELGGIEKEIHETNLVLKARLLAAFKVIRARMANWEKQRNANKKKSEGARLRAQWTELGKVEEEIHITNQEMKRRIRKVIRVIKEKMGHFEKGAEEARRLANQQNPNRPGRSHFKVPAAGSDSLE